MTTGSLILGLKSQRVFSDYFQHALQIKRMGWFTAFIYTLIIVLAHVFLRIESKKWIELRAMLGPWFLHLTNRPYKPLDPLRYLLQLLWIIVTEPMPRKLRRSPELLIRFQQWLTGLHAFILGLLEKVPSALRYTSPVREFSTWVGTASRVVRILIYGCTIVVCLMLAILIVTQPFSLQAQAIFVGLLWGLAVIVKRIPSGFSTLVLIVLSLTMSTRYLWWRYTSTLNLEDALDAFFGIMLIIAETYSWIVLVLGYFQIARPLNRPPAVLPTDTSKWPVVDLMIPTYNEDLSVVRPTVYAALGIDWPKDKLRIHLLDDGRRDEFKNFSESVGINYLVRPDNKHAKAGNLNHALTLTNGELIAIFDCDHIPTRSFLQVTVGWFLVDPKLALVQTPHHFFSPDPFERNLGQYREQPNENTLFYGLVQDGNDLWNAAFFCGSCAVLRRSAIESIGGFAVETVTEDAHTALRLHRMGYNSAYLRTPQAAGLATESLSAHVGQRIRWARGMVQIFRMDNPMFGKGLSLFQRICYTNAMMHFLSGIPRIIYLIAPLSFLVFHSYMLYAPTLAILLYVTPHMIHSVMTNSRMQGAYRRTFWAEIYETVLAWYIARPTTIALFNPHKGKFNVTAKGGMVEKQYFDWDISQPYIFLAALNIAGFFFGMWRLFFGPQDELLTVIITMLWVIYNLTILGGAIAVASEVRQVRRTHRVATEMQASLQLSSGHVLPVTMTDFSEGGTGVMLSTPDDRIKLHDAVQLILSQGSRLFYFPAHFSRAIGLSIGLRFDPLSQQQHIDLVKCTFARADSWLLAQESYPKDKPLKSLKSIFVVSYRGFQQMAIHLPFPFSAVMSAFTNILAWLASFMPVTEVEESMESLEYIHGNRVTYA